MKGINERELYVSTHRERIKIIKEKMIPATALYDRWPGLLKRELTDVVNSALQGTTISLGQQELQGVFPEPYSIEKIQKDKEGNIVASCLTLRGAGLRPGNRWPQNLYFRQSEVEKYEADNPLVLVVPITPEEAWAISAPQQVDLGKAVRALQKENASLKAPPTKEAKKTSANTVNAAKWKGSVTAAFEVWAYIVMGDKADWKEDEFREAVEAKFRDYHTGAVDVAWRKLPQEFKNGSGRPKKKQK